MQPSQHPIILKVHRGLANNEVLKCKRLNSFCIENNIDAKNAHRYLRFEINSEPAEKARQIIFAAANIDYFEALKICKQAGIENV